MRLIIGGLQNPSDSYVALHNNLLKPPGKKDPPMRPAPFKGKLSSGTSPTISRGHWPRSSTSTGWCSRQIDRFPEEPGRTARGLVDLAPQGRRRRDRGPRRCSRRGLQAEGAQGSGSGAAARRQPAAPEGRPRTLPRWRGMADSAKRSVRTRGAAQAISVTNTARSAPGNCPHGLSWSVEGPLLPPDTPSPR